MPQSDIIVPHDAGSSGGGGYSSGYLTRGGMPVTMFRLNLTKGLGPSLQIAEGYTVDLPETVDRTLEERTDRTWPTTWFPHGRPGRPIP